MTDMQFIRTDRNGTKIFHDWTCPRCGGAGRSDNWWRTGYICHECGGAGKRRSPKVVKEYTPEYAEKLEARRVAKLAKLPKPDEADLKARAEEARRNRWQEQGFSADGIGFLYMGDTFKHKDAFRRAGGRWNCFIRAWVTPQKVEDIPGVQIIEIHAQDVCNEYDYIDCDKIDEIRENI